MERFEIKVRIVDIWLFVEYINFSEQVFIQYTYSERSYFILFLGMYLKRNVSNFSTFTLLSVLCLKSYLVLCSVPYEWDHVIKCALSL